MKLFNINQSGGNPFRGSVRTSPAIRKTGTTQLTRNIRPTTIPTTSGPTISSIKEQRSTTTTAKGSAAGTLPGQMLIRRSQEDPNRITVTNPLTGQQITMQVPKQSIDVDEQQASLISDKLDQMVETLNKQLDNVMSDIRMKLNSKDCSTQGQVNEHTITITDHLSSNKNTIKDTIDTADTYVSTKSNNIVNTTINLNGKIDGLDTTSEENKSQLEILLNGQTKTLQSDISTHNASINDNLTTTGKQIRKKINDDNIYLDGIITSNESDLVSVINSEMANIKDNLQRQNTTLDGSMSNIRVDTVVIRSILEKLELGLTNMDMDRIINAIQDKKCKMDMAGVINTINTVNCKTTGQEINQKLDAFSCPNPDLNDVITELQNKKCSTNQELMLLSGDIQSDITGKEGLLSGRLDATKQEILNRLSNEMATINTTLVTNTDNIRQSVSNTKDIVEESRQELRNRLDGVNSVINTLYPTLSEFNRNQLLTKIESLNNTAEIANVLAEVKNINCNVDLSGIQEALGEISFPETNLSRVIQEIRDKQCIIQSNLDSHATNIIDKIDSDRIITKNRILNKITEIQNLLNEQSYVLQESTSEQNSLIGLIQDRQTSIKATLAAAETNMLVGDIVRIEDAINTSTCNTGIVNVLPELEYVMQEINQFRPDVDLSTISSSIGSLSLESPNFTSVIEEIKKKQCLSPTEVSSKTTQLQTALTTLYNEINNSIDSHDTTLNQIISKQGTIKSLLNNTQTNIPTTDINSIRDAVNNSQCDSNIDNIVTELENVMDEISSFSPIVDMSLVANSIGSLSLQPPDFGSVIEEINKRQCLSDSDILAKKSILQEALDTLYNSIKGSIDGYSPDLSDIISKQGAIQELIDNIQTNIPSADITRIADAVGNSPCNSNISEVIDDLAVANETINKIQCDANLSGIDEHIAEMKLGEADLTSVIEQVNKLKCASDENLRDKISLIQTIMDARTEKINSNLSTQESVIEEILQNQTTIENVLNNLGTTLSENDMTIIRNALYSSQCSTGMTSIIEKLNTIMNSTGNVACNIDVTAIEEKIKTLECPLPDFTPVYKAIAEQECASDMDIQTEFANIEDAIKGTTATIEDKITANRDSILAELEPQLDSLGTVEENTVIMENRVNDITKVNISTADIDRIKAVLTQSKCDVNIEEILSELTTLKNTMSGISCDINTDSIIAEIQSLQCPVSTRQEIINAIVDKQCVNQRSIDNEFTSITDIITTETNQINTKINDISASTDNITSTTNTIIDTIEKHLITTEENITTQEAIINSLNTLETNLSSSDITLIKNALNNTQCNAGMVNILEKINNINTTVSGINCTIDMADVRADLESINCPMPDIEPIINQLKEKQCASTTIMQDAVNTEITNINQQISNISNTINTNIAGNKLYLDDIILTISTMSDNLSAVKNTLQNLEPKLDPSDLNTILQAITNKTCTTDITNIVSEMETLTKDVNNIDKTALINSIKSKAGSLNCTVPNIANVINNVTTELEQKCFTGDLTTDMQSITTDINTNVSTNTNINNIANKITVIQNNLNIIKNTLKNNLTTAIHGEQLSTIKNSIIDNSCAFELDDIINDINMNITTINSQEAVISEITNKINNINCPNPNITTALDEIVKELKINLDTKCISNTDLTTRITNLLGNISPEMQELINKSIPSGTCITDIQPVLDNISINKAKLDSIRNANLDISLDTVFDAISDSAVATTSFSQIVGETSDLTARMETLIDKFPNLKSLAETLSTKSCVTPFEIGSIINIINTTGCTSEIYNIIDLLNKNNCGSPDTTALNDALNQKCPKRKCTVQTSYCENGTSPRNYKITGLNPGTCTVDSGKEVTIECDNGSTLLQGTSVPAKCDDGTIDTVGWNSTTKLQCGPPKCTIPDKYCGNGNSKPGYTITGNNSGTCNVESGTNATVSCISGANVLEGTSTKATCTNDGFVSEGWNSATKLTCEGSNCVVPTKYCNSGSPVKGYRITGINAGTCDTTTGGSATVSCESDYNTQGTGTAAQCSMGTFQQQGWNSAVKLTCTPKKCTIPIKYCENGTAKTGYNITGNIPDTCQVNTRDSPTVTCAPGYIPSEGNENSAQCNGETISTVGWNASPNLTCVAAPKCTIPSYYCNNGNSSRNDFTLSGNVPGTCEVNHGDTVTVRCKESPGTSSKPDTLVDGTVVQDGNETCQMGTLSRNTWNKNDNLVCTVGYPGSIGNNTAIDGPMLGTYTFPSSGWGQSYGHQACDNNPNCWGFTWSNNSTTGILYPLSNKKLSQNDTNNYNYFSTYKKNAGKRCSTNGAVIQTFNNVQKVGINNLLTSILSSQPTVSGRPPAVNVINNGQTVEVLGDMTQTDHRNTIITQSNDPNVTCYTREGKRTLPYYAI